jgi:hypothetical protein
MEISKKKTKYTCPNEDNGKQEDYLSFQIPDLEKNLRLSKTSELEYPMQNITHEQYLLILKQRKIKELISNSLF